MFKIVALNLRNILYLHHQTTTKQHTDMTTLQTLNAGTQYYNNELTETTYRTIEIIVKSNVYAITIAEGRYNYFFIKQKNHSSFGGKYFATLDMAIDSYKSMAMKAALMQIK